MLEFNDRAELVVVLDAHAITEIGGRDCHVMLLQKMNHCKNNLNIIPRMLRDNNHLMGTLRKHLIRCFANHAKIF